MLKDIGRDLGDILSDPAVIAEIMGVLNPAAGAAQDLVDGIGNLIDNVQTGGRPMSAKSELTCYGIQLATAGSPLAPYMCSTLLTGQDKETAIARGDLSIDIGLIALTKGKGAGAAAETRAAAGEARTIGKQIADAAKACLRSFTAATAVLMADGTTKPIADIRPGDKVTTTDPETKQQSVQTVDAVWKHTDQRTDLTLNTGETIQTTPDHPFWSETRQQFIEVKDLQAGERLEAADRTVVAVTGQAKASGESVVYNLTVAQTQTYFVGADGILVHNTGCGRRPIKEVRAQADAAVTDAQGVMRCPNCKIEMRPDAGFPNSREYDHKIPYSSGGGREIDNIWSLCRSCNRTKSSKLLEELGW
ncbi:hypothetical protein CGZ95_01215 [Enemella evansiae]|uniref:polymorphic toxin-type HINT domain-containing protein n=1 Tax=Enemella evansiae TaxID=2016499 RepID=UPI000B963241|nr:polymorphic toxin-type HINT domain-containing protein [Enemella evansiae]OYO04959.1 hypothetical protein CGZ95_01215 [Enemella evansiae]